MFTEYELSWNVDDGELFKITFEYESQAMKELENLKVLYSNNDFEAWIEKISKDVVHSYEHYKEAE